MPNSKQIEERRMMHSATRDEIVLFIGKLMQLEITLVKISQIRSDNSHLFPLICGFQNSLWRYKTTSMYIIYVNTYESRRESWGRKETAVAVQEGWGRMTKEKEQGRVSMVNIYDIH